MRRVAPSRVFFLETRALYPVATQKKRQPSRKWSENLEKREKFHTFIAQRVDRMEGRTALH